MKENRLRIEISVVGSANTGKTTVAELIQNALDVHGIPAELAEPVDTHAPFSHRIQALREKETTAVIYCVQTARRKDVQ